MNKNLGTLDKISAGIPPAVKTLHLTYQKVSTPSEWIMMEKHLSGNYRQLKIPSHFYQTLDEGQYNIQGIYQLPFKDCSSNSLVLLVKSSRQNFILRTSSPPEMLIFLRLKYLKYYISCEHHEEITFAKYEMHNKD